MLFESFEDRLVHALTLDIPYPERPPSTRGIPAAVLIVFGEREGEISLLITRRTEIVETHKGQMAFPGGHSEPEEISLLEDGSVITALRETEEEVGLPRSGIRVLGRLPDLWTVTGFWVTPIVGVLNAPIDAFPLRINEHEIAEAAWIPLCVLRDPGIYALEHKRVGKIDYPIHVYQVDNFRIWGATGSMIKNLLDRLQTVAL